MIGRLEVVSCCFGYSDFLSEVIPYNIGHFDRWLIATSPDDEGTREVCRKWGLPTLLTEEHQRDGEFSKGRVIERSLQHLSADSWRIHLDSDIVLPSSFRRALDMAHLDESKIYGCDRVMIKSWEEWQKFKTSGWLNQDYHCRINFPSGYQVGTRWGTETAGWLPVGFMQIWSGKADQYHGVRVRPYPIHHSTACRTDVQHALQWDRRKRELLPELIVAHLESEPAKLGANWKGRTTKRFGPPSLIPDTCSPIS